MQWKWVDIRVQSYGNEMQWNEYTSKYYPYDINMSEFPSICKIYLIYIWWNVQYPGNHVPLCHIPVKFQAIAMLISCVYCLYTPKRKLENKGGNKQSHSNEHIMRYLNEWHTCTLKTACTSYVALVYVCTHKQSLCITSVHAKIK